MQSQSIYISLLALFMDSSSSSYFSVQNSIGKNSAWHSFSTTSEKPLLAIFRKKPDAIIISQNPCGFPPVITFLHKNFPVVGRFVFLASSSTKTLRPISSYHDELELKIQCSILLLNEEKERKINQVQVSRHNITWDISENITD